MPRWIVIALAAFLAVAIFVIVVHPYYDVSSATVGEKMLHRVFSILVTLMEGTVLFLAGAAFLASLPRPQPIVSVKPACTRRI
jgi:hypothetical protein